MEHARQGSPLTLTQKVNSGLQSHYINVNGALVHVNYVNICLCSPVPGR